MKLRKWLSPILYPLSLAYGMITSLRNFLYDTGRLKSFSFNIPVISVGNITVGGTGKTPHVEYLVDILSGRFKVAVLSRGYRRRTRGFVLASETSAPGEIGDEPYQIMSKTGTQVAVCEDRVKGIKLLKDIKPPIQCIILDDAFQHRSVKPGLSILLVDYNRPLYTDHMLPYGNLRENRKNIVRADIIIVTKIPSGTDIVNQFEWSRLLGVRASQLIYFTQFSYGKLAPVFGNYQDVPAPGDIKNSKCSIMLVTGIANPESLYNELLKTGCSIVHLRYPDHHEYNRYDMDVIRTKFKLMSQKRIIITTEKDAVKISRISNVDDEIKQQFYYLPINIEFMNGKAPEFNQVIKGYVEKNKGRR